MHSSTMNRGREMDELHTEGSGQLLDDTPSTPPPPADVRDALPTETHMITNSPGLLLFDSPDVRPPPPPGASQPNVPLNHLAASAASQSPLSHIQPPKSKRPQHKFSMLRKKGRSQTTPSSSTPQAQSPTSPDDDDDDEWLLEGTSSNGHVNATVSVGREASNLSRSVDTLSLADSDSGEPARSSTTIAVTAPMSGAPATGRANTNGGGGAEKLSKTRSLAKKTSRLFGRNNGHGNSHHQHEESGSGSLTLPGASTVRQNSISSHGSNDSRQKHWSLSRVNSSKSSPPPRGTPDSSSQPSSWHPPPAFALRRTTSQTTDTETGIITSPVAIPQLRNRESSSHLSTSVPVLRNDSSTSIHTLNHNHHHHHHNQHQSPQSHSSLQRPDPTLPSRMSSWFTNLIPTTTASAGPTPIEQSPPALGESAILPASPMRKPPGVAASIFSAARNKAVGGMRYLLDSEAQPDHCQETMWVMGVPHPGFMPENAYKDSPAASPPSWTTRFKEGSGTSSSSPPMRTGGFSHFFGSSFNLAGQAAEPATPPSESSNRSKDKQKELLKWPEQFHDDFRSRAWCTYRSQYAPILPLAPGQLLPTPDSYFGAFVGSTSEGTLPQPGQTSVGSQPSRLSNGPWGWVKGDDRGLTSDAGWGCMLRTGQSLLANALIHLHLGRGWRLPSNKPSSTPESPLELAELEAYATYVRILSWFFDDPSPLCPFSVHRMALIGKELGKEVGEWFGPSTAAGALKTLVNSFPLCGLGVVNAVDGTIYRSDVYSASNISSDAWVEDDDAPRRSRPSSVHRTGWGGKPVLILIGLRLGVDGVNPIYYDSIKTLFTFPHSVGIAGGRPSSSYYFVASQGNSLFYLDPHFTRPAVPLRVPPPKAARPPGRRAASVFASERDSVHFEDDDDDSVSLAPAISRTSESSPLPIVDVVNLDNDVPEPVSELQSPSKPRRRLTLTQTLRIKPGSPSRKSSAPASPTTPTIKGLGRRTSQPSPSPSRPAPTRHSTASSSSSLRSRALPVDPQTAWYASAYSEANLKTFHCDKVKKLPLSGLDPSMLIGFLCQTEAEFDDFCERVAKLPQKIFAVQEEPPFWSEDEDGLESVSEPVSDIGSDVGSDKDEEPDLDLDDMDEFGHMSRPLGPQRDDTITPLTAAAVGLGLDTRGGMDTSTAVDDAEDADTEEEADTTARLLARKARRSSEASTSSQRRIKKQESTGNAAEVLRVSESTATLSAAPHVTSPPVKTDYASEIEFGTSDDEPTSVPIARVTRPVDAATPPRPVRPARLGNKPQRKPPKEVFTTTDDEALQDTLKPAAAHKDDKIVPPSRNQSLSAKASIASLNKAATAIDIPSPASKSSSPTLGPRQRTTVRNLKAYAAAQAAQTKVDSDGDNTEPPELLNHSEAETEIEHVSASDLAPEREPERELSNDDRDDAQDTDDHDPDMSFENVELGSTPSSAPVMIERPSPRS